MIAGWLPPPPDWCVSCHRYAGECMGLTGCPRLQRFDPSTTIGGTIEVEAGPPILNRKARRANAARARAAPRVMSREHRYRAHGAGSPEFVESVPRMRRPSRA